MSKARIPKRCAGGSRKDKEDTLREASRLLKRLKKEERRRRKRKGG